MTEPGYRGAQLEEDEIVIYLDNDYNELFTDDHNAAVISKRETKDPFEALDINYQSRKMKRKHNTLAKRFEGQNGAKSKYLDPNQVWGYGIFDVVIPPYDLEALSALFDENPVLRAAVEARVMNTVGAGFTWAPTPKAQKRVAKNSGEAEKADRVRNQHTREQQKLEDLLEQFNDDETFIETLIKVWLDAMVLGTGYLEIGRTVSGKVGYVGHIPSRYMRMRKNRDGFVQLTNATKRAVFFRNFGDLTTADPINEDPSPNEIIAFKIYSPNHSYYGIPPSASAIAAIVGDKFAKEYNIDFFENKAVPRYAIILKGVKLSAQSKKELIGYFKNELKGKNHGTLVIPLPASIGGADADVRFEALENKIQDASFENYRKMNREEIVMAYRVPPTKISIIEGGNLAMSRDADKTFKSQVIGPDQIIIEKKINKIVEEFSDLFRISLNQIDLIDEDLQSRIHDRYLRTEVMTPNEVRAEKSLPPIDGGDEVLPYPVNAQLKVSEMDDKLKRDQLKQQKEQADKAHEQQLATIKAGAPAPGSNNAAAGSPPKSGQDSGRATSSAVMAGTNKEKGQGQDTSGTRERKR